VLRPLGLGEILDRAVTLCVRHFALFSLIFVVYAIPIAVLQYFGTADQAKMFGALTDVFRAQAAGKSVDPNALSKVFAQPSVLNVWTGLWFFALLFVAPLPTVALIDAAATIYLGGSITFERAYRTALARWLPMIGINILYFACAIGLYIVLLIVVLVVGLGLMAIYKVLGGLAIAILVLLGILFVLALFAFGLVASLAVQISYFSCVVERMPFITAFSRGISRVLARPALRRSLLAGLAFYAILLGIFIVSLAGQSLLFGLLKSNVAGTVYETIVQVATAAFTTAFLAIFYFDLRVRSEGLDLQVAAGGQPLSAS
jgi:hypothetical protein